MDVKKIHVLYLRSFMMALISVMAVGGAGLYVMYWVESSAIGDAMDQAAILQNDVMTRSISHDLEDLVVDLRTMASHVEVGRYLNNPSEQGRREVGEEFLAFVRLNERYDQCRLLDVHGQELVRINYNNGHPLQVPTKHLQNKAGRYYFEESLKLKPDEVYVSPFDLNVENGAIEQPLKPMIRVSTAVFDSSGRMLGIVILNYFGKHIFDSIREILVEEGNEPMLLNGDGYWLLSPDKSQEWGFMYPDHKSDRFGLEHPRVWKTMQDESHGQVRGSDGVYTFDRVQVVPESSKWKGNSRHWYMVCFLPEAYISGHMSQLARNYWLVYLGIFLLGLLLALSRGAYVRGRAISWARLEEAREAAEEANRAKSDFLARMSHEIRTPMNAIIGLSHLALKTSLNFKQRDYLEKVLLSAQTLLGIINDILDFSKIEADRLEIENTDFRLGDVVNNVFNILSFQAKTKDIQFSVRMGPSIPSRVVGDPLRLGQVLINLLGNAIKFTEKGDVLLMVRVLGTDGSSVMVEFAAKDSGIGIPEEKMNQLFQPFSQADGSISRKYGGTGLGLVISQRLVGMMGGEIKVTSRPGEGSVFSFAIPLGLPDDMGEDNSQLCPLELRGLRVLVVDDMPDDRTTLVTVLRSFSFLVSEAGDGHTAMEMLRREDGQDPFRLVFVDWRMPGMDGFELCRNIHQEKVLSHVPKVVMLTAYSHDEVRYRAERECLDGVVLKPYHPSLIFDVIMDVFGHSLANPVEGSCGEAITDMGSGLKGKRILLAEDNRLNQQVAVEILESCGMAVDVAEDGRQVLEMVERKHYDAVLMDIQMPVMDGITATKRLRADASWADLPIIAMTAHALAGDRTKSLDAGMNDHVTKPVDPLKLVETLCKWLLEEGAACHAGLLDSQSSVDESERKDLPGVDWRAGLNRVMGNEKLYGDLLRGFVDNGRDVPDKLRELVEQDRLDEAREIAHSIKGNAGNVGAMDLYSLLQEVELKLETGPPAPELLDRVEGEFKKVVNGILGSDFAEEDPETPEADVFVGRVEPEDLIPAIETFLSLLRSHNAGSKTVFQKLEPRLRGLWPEDTRRLRSLLDRYEFHECEKMVRQMFGKYLSQSADPDR